MPRALIPLMLVATLLVACGSAGSPDIGTDVSGEAPAPIMPQPDTDFGRGGASGGEAGGGNGFAPEPIPGDDGAPTDGERQIIRTGSISLEVDDIDAAFADIRDLAEDMDGWISGAQMGGRDESGQLTLRVPAAKFDTAVAALRGMGEQLSFTAAEDDVTTTLIDLEARLENLRSAEESYRELLEQAVNVEEVLMVQSRLDEIRGQIESLDGQRAYLQRQADTATLTVVLSTPAAPVTEQTEDFDPGAIFTEALAGLVAAGQALLVVAIYAVVIGVPASIVAGIVLVPLWLLRRRRATRRNEEAAE